MKAVGKKRRIMDIENMDISPELREKAKACKTPEELLALAKKEGYKLSEEELSAVSGGVSWSSCYSLNSTKKCLEDAYEKTCMYY